MTLIVSLRIPDGVVIAGDSLSAMMVGAKARAQKVVKCPNCKGSHQVGMEVNLPVFPTSTFSYAQKVFSFLGNYGIGVYGQGQIAGKTPYFIFRQLENELAGDMGGPGNQASDVAEKIKKRLSEIVLGSMTEDQINSAPKGWIALGVQVAGYDEDKPLTIEVQVGQESRLTYHKDFGCTVSGKHEVTMALWDLAKSRPEGQAMFQAFSLQDAIDYADFLINTTSQYQRFSRSTPTVGGAIDVALVTPFDGFKWIRQKPLALKIEGGRNDKE